MYKTAMLNKTASLINYKLQKEAFNPVSYIDDVARGVKTFVKGIGKGTSNAVAKATKNNATLSDDMVKYITTQGEDLASTKAALETTKTALKQSKNQYLDLLGDYRGVNRALKASQDETKQMTGNALKNAGTAAKERAKKGEVARKAFGDKLKFGIERKGLQGEVEASKRSTAKAISDAQRGSARTKQIIAGYEKQVDNLLKQGKLDAKALADLQAKYNLSQQDVITLLKEKGVDKVTIANLQKQLAKSERFGEKAISDARRGAAKNKQIISGLENQVSNLTRQGKLDAKALADLQGKYDLSQEQMVALLESQGIDRATISRLTAETSKYKDLALKRYRKIRQLNAQLDEAVRKGNMSAAEAEQYKRMAEAGQIDSRNLAQALSTEQVRSRNLEHLYGEASRKLEGATAENAAKAKTIKNQSALINAQDQEINSQKAELQAQLKRIRNLKWGMAGTGIAGTGIGVGGYAYANHENERRYNNVKQAR